MENQCKNAIFENCDLAAHVLEPFRICVASFIFAIKAMEMTQSDGHMDQLDEFMREVDGLSLAWVCIFAYDTNEFRRMMCGQGQFN